MLALVLMAVVQVWQPCAPIPTPGWGMACAAVDGRIYCIGGKFRGPDSIVPRLAVEAYDVGADSWITGFAPLPSPHCYPGCAVLDGKIYVVAGSDGHNDTRRVHRFDPVTSQWDTVAALPWPRNALAACTFDGSIYAAGGLTGDLQWCSYKRTVFRFSPGDDSGPGSWTVIDSLNTPRSSFGLVAVGGQLNAVGGTYYSNLKSFEFYNPNEWRNDSRMMRASRGGLAVVGSGDYLCAIGGFGQHGMLSSVEILDLTGGEWTATEGLSEPRAYLSAAVVNDRVFVIGGMDEQQQAISAVEADSVLPAGIEETRPGTLELPRFATVVRGRARIDCGQGAEVRIYNDAGSMVLEGAGTVEAELAPGVYFIRAQSEGRVRTGRLAVVR